MSVADPIMPSQLKASTKKHAEHVEHLEHVEVKATTNDSVPKVIYEITEQWHSQPKHLRVIHVGAGAAGLLMAYKMQKDFENYSLVCYEKNPEVGGTWFENRYPGCACDVCVVHSLQG